MEVRRDDLPTAAVAGLISASETIVQGQTRIFRGFGPRPISEPLHGRVNGNRGSVASPGLSVGELDPESSEHGHPFYESSLDIHPCSFAESLPGCRSKIGSIQLEYQISDNA